MEIENNISRNYIYSMLARSSAMKAFALARAGAASQQEELVPEFSQSI